MTKEEVKSFLEGITDKEVLCGYLLQDKGKSVLLVTQHYIMGEYCALYINDQIHSQFTITEIREEPDFSHIDDLDDDKLIELEEQHAIIYEEMKDLNAQQVMDKMFRNSVNTFIEDGIEIVKLFKRDIVID